MSILNSLEATSKKAISSGEDYVEATQDYIELKVFQQISLSFSFIIKIFLIGGLCFFGLTLLVIAGVIALGKYIGSFELALLYSSLVIFSISFFVFLLRKQLIESPTIKKISTSFFKD